MQDWQPNLPPHLPGLRDEEASPAQVTSAWTSTDQFSETTGAPFDIDWVRGDKDGDPSQDHHPDF